MLTTTTRYGVYSITLRIDADRQAGETRRVIQSILAAHSGGAGLQVTEPDAGRIPVLSIVLSSGALPRLEVSDYAARHIQPRLVRSLDGAGDVHLCRDMSTALMVHLDPSVWRRMDVTGGDMHDVLGPAIAGFGGETGYAGVSRKGDSYAIALAPGSVRALDGLSLADREIALPDGRRIQLRDIARVEVGAQPTHDFCFYRGRRATIVQVDPRRPVGLEETLARLGREVQAISRDLPASIDLTIVPTSTTYRR
jgi:multidrug efflux pump subunit AcrB